MHLLSIELKKSEEKDKEGNKEKTKEAEKKEDKILAPQPYLVTKVSVQWWIPTLLFVFTVLASVLLTLSPDIFKSLGEIQYIQQNYKDVAEILVKNTLLFSGIGKALGAFCTLVAAFLAFRKLPVGGK